MRTPKSLLVVLPLVCALLACGGSDLQTGTANGGEEAGEESLVSGLLDKARGMLPGAAEEAQAAAKAEEAKIAQEAIVRCDVGGTITYTRASECDNRGGYSMKMALKKK